MDEEDRSGQCETTLRPSMNVEFIDEDIVYTAGEIRLSDGRSLPALLELMDGEVVGVTAFTSNAGGWSVRLLGSPAEWICIVEDWLPPESRSPSVDPNDTTIFPAIASTRLRCATGGSVLTCNMDP